MDLEGIIDCDTDYDVYYESDNDADEDNWYYFSDVSIQY